MSEHVSRLKELGVERVWVSPVGLRSAVPTDLRRGDSVQEHAEPSWAETDGYAPP